MNRKTTGSGRWILDACILISGAMLIWGFTPWGPYGHIGPAARDAITEAVIPAQVTDTINDVTELVDQIGDLTAIEDRLVEQVAEQCALLTASGMNGECVVRLATPTEALADDILLRELLTP